MPKQTEKKPAAAKYEWRKTEKAFYLPKEKGPVRIDVPEMKFFAVEGAGSPADEEFQARIGLLYALSYTIRMMPKSGWTPPDYQEYTVFPLEGMWRMDTDAWQGGALDKTKLKYRLMIRQPWFVTPDVAGRAMESARKKVPADLLERASFETFTDGPSVQMLHVGPYDTEPESFAAMNAFLKAHGLVRTEQLHREIYLSDPRRVSPEKKQNASPVFPFERSAGRAERRTLRKQSK